MAKQSILGRIAQMAKANINALLDSAEDPQLMLDQMVRDYTNSIAEAESAVAQTIGNLRLLEQDYKEDVDAAGDWGRKALAASAKADELRSGGNTADADKFDNLAKVALGKQMGSEKEARDAEPTIASQTEVVAKLNGAMRTALAAPAITRAFENLGFTAAYSTPEQMQARITQGKAVYQRVVSERKIKVE